MFSKFFSRVLVNYNQSLRTQVQMIENFCEQLFKSIDHSTIFEALVHLQKAILGHF